MQKTVPNCNAGLVHVVNGVNPRNLYLHQVEAIKALNDKLQGQDFYEGLLVLPTGGGKTLTAIKWLLKNIIDSGQKVLWIAHRHELLNQALEALVNNSYSDVLQMRKSFRFRLISGLHDRPINITPDDDFIIASKDSINYGLPYLIDNWVKVNSNNIFLVIDEAHHAVAKSYRNIINIVKEHNKDSFKMLGLTATPFRTMENEQGLLKLVFKNDIAYAVDLKTLINRGILADPIFIDSSTQIDMARDLTDNDIKIINSSDKLPREVAENIALSKERNNLIVNHYLQNRQKYGQTLVFALTIQHAIELKAVFEKYGIKCDYVVSSIKDSFTGVTISKEQNAEKIQAFKNGQLDVLINVNILTEGTDLPSVQTVFLTRPTISTILMTQMIGRALRGPMAGGTKQAYIVSFIDDWKDKIAWVNPRKLYEDNRTFTDSSPDDKKEHIVRLIAIGKIEEFAKMMDDTVDTSGLEEVDFIERIPVGVYSFGVLIPSANEETNEKHCDILIYNSFKQAYEDFINDLEFLFDSKQLSEKEYLEEYELNYLCEEVKREFFSGYDTTICYKDEDIKDVLRYFAQTSAKPRFMPFEERDDYDIRRIAQEVWNNDMGERKKAAYLDQLWQDEKSFLRIFFGDNKRYFISQINNELYKLSMSGSSAEERPGTVKDQIELKKLALWELRKVAPEHWRQLMNSVYDKYKDAEGYYFSASGNFRSKSKRDFQIDHINPMSKGGLTEVDNLQLLTVNENLTKGSKYMEDSSKGGEEVVNDENKEAGIEELLREISGKVSAGTSVTALIEEGAREFNNSMYFKRIGKMFQDAGDLARARTAYRRALELNNDHRGVLESTYNLAGLYFVEEDYTTSEEYARKCLELEPKYSIALGLLGSIKYSTGDNNEALKYYDEAIGAGEVSELLYLEKGDILSGDDDKLDEAIESYSKAARINPESADAYFGMGVCYYYKDDYRTALDSFNRGLALEEGNGAVHYHMGSCLQALKKYDDAIAEYKTALGLEPDNVDALFELALALDRKRRYPEAVEHYKKVISLDPMQADAYNNLGYTYQKMKEFKNALECYNKALEIDPSHKFARANKKNLAKISYLDEI